MTEQQHVSIEDLAAFAAGDLDAAAAVTVEAHVVLCDECRSDVAAIRATTDALAALPSEPMPGLVAARLDSALAAERDAAREPAGTVLPMAPRRRRPSFAGVAAVAAVVALFAAISIPIVTGGGRSEDGAGGGSSADSLAAPEATGTRRLSSGLNYTRDQLAPTLARALGGDVVATAGDDAAPGTALGTLPPGQESKPAVAPRTAAEQLTPLRTDPGRFAACVAELVGTGPAAGRVPLLIDFAAFSGREAVVLVFPSIQSNGQPRPGRIDVYVVGPACGSEPGGDVIDFQRIARPAGL